MKLQAFMLFDSLGKHAQKNDLESVSPQVQKKKTNPQKNPHHKKTHPICSPLPFRDNKSHVRENLTE